MHDGSWWFFGMHAFWWLFWVAIIVLFFSLLTPVPKQQARTRGTALDILQRRLATGEISTEEYERRRAILLRDSAVQQ